MNTLRWILGLTLVLVGGGYVALLVFSNGIRRSLRVADDQRVRDDPVVGVLYLALWLAFYWWAAWRDAAVC